MDLVSSRHAHAILKGDSYSFEIVPRFEFYFLLKSFRSLKIIPKAGRQEEIVLEDVVHRGRIRRTERAMIFGEEDSE